MSDVVVGSETVGPSCPPPVKTHLAWGAAVFTLGVVAFVMLRLMQSSMPVPREAAGPIDPTNHCSQFIALAKAKYGIEWKYRLDPRDTICRDEVQLEWERQWMVRGAEPPAPQREPLTLQPTIIEQPAPGSEAARVRNPETYCLNVYSLAQAKYGAAWRSKIDPASNCALPVTQ